MVLKANGDRRRTGPCGLWKGSLEGDVQAAGTGFGRANAGVSTN